MSSQRRRQRSHYHHQPSVFQDRVDPASTLNIQAYEADIRHGRREDGRERLMRWEGERERGSSGIDDAEIWIDRHSILHLLPCIPPLLTSTSPTSSTSTGFTDLPSDAEDTFFFSSDEDEEVSYERYERAKKRRKVEMGREERLRAMERGVKDGRVVLVEKEEQVVRDEDEWLSDEEPSESIRQLMTHTLTSLLKSPNPQILELRILTHHSNDARFSFLKGRYRRRWERMKREGEKKDVTLEESQSEMKKNTGLVGMMGEYGSDESDEEGEGEQDGLPVFRSPRSPPPSPPTPPPPPPDEDETRATSPGEQNGQSDNDGNEATERDSHIVNVATTLQPDDVEDQKRQRRREKARLWAASKGT